MVDYHRSWTRRAAYKSEDCDVSDKEFEAFLGFERDPFESEGYKAECCDVFEGEEDVDIGDSENFYQALKSGDLEYVKKFILEFRTDVRAPISPKNESCPLKVAAENGQVEITDYLATFPRGNSEVCYQGPPPLVAVALSSDVSEDLLEKCAASLIDVGNEDVNCKDSLLNMTPLMASAKTGLLKLATLFVSRGADVEEENSLTWTALCYASHYGKGHVARFLLSEAGASPYAMTMEGYQPVELAELNGQHKVATLIESFMRKQSELSGYLFEQKMASQELVSFLKGFGLTSAECHKFIEAGITDVYGLTRLTSEDITHKIGMTRIGVVKNLTEFIKTIHMQKWKRSCLPEVNAYDPVEGLHFTCPDAVLVIGNVYRQIEYLRSTVIYIKNGITSKPGVLDIGKDVRNVRDLDEFVKKCVINLEGLRRDFAGLKKSIAPHISTKAQVADFIGEKKKSRKLIYFSIIACAAVGIGTGLRFWRVYYV